MRGQGSQLLRRTAGGLDPHEAILRRITQVRIAFGLVALAMIPLIRGSGGVRMAFAALTVGAWIPWSIVVGRLTRTGVEFWPRVVLAVAVDALIVYGYVSLSSSLVISGLIGLLAIAILHTLVRGWPAGIATAVFATGCSTAFFFTYREISLITLIPFVTVTPLMVLAVDRLLAEQRAAAARAEVLNRSKSELIGVVSHDLRSPLTVVRGMAELMEQSWDALPDAQRRDLLRRIRVNAERIEQMLARTLDVAESERGTLPSQSSDFDIEALARKVIDESTPVGREITLQSASALPLVHGNPDRQWQILSNLLSNAMKYSKDAVAVSLDNGNGAVSVSVRDRGIGMRADEVERALLPFTRVASTAAKGRGLGLYIVKTLVEAQGGTLSIVTAPNEGSTFTYTLPAATGD